MANTRTALVILRWKNEFRVLDGRPMGTAIPRQNLTAPKTLGVDLEGCNERFILT